MFLANLFVISFYRFDHHCPWLSNCVGWKNHKYFIGYLFALVIMCLIYFLGACSFWKLSCTKSTSSINNVVRIITCNTWVTFMTAQAVVHGVWVVALLVCQLYQVSNLVFFVLRNIVFIK